MTTNLTRRQFVLRSGASLGALSLAQALAACGGSSSSGSSTSSSNGGQPRHGGVFTFTHEGTPPGYDPQKWWNAQAGVAAAVIAEPLIALDSYSGKRIPKLAIAEPQISADGTVYTFKLRPGVKFHGGSGTLTAEDVKYSWERVMSPQLASEAGSLYTSIAFHGLADFLSGKSKEISGLRAVDDHTFEVTLDRGDSAFLPTFTYAQAVILPASYYSGKTPRKRSTGSRSAQGPTCSRARTRPRARSCRSETPTTGTPASPISTPSMSTTTSIPNSPSCASSKASRMGCWSRSRLPALRSCEGILSISRTTTKGRRTTASGCRSRQP